METDKLTAVRSRDEIASTLASVQTELQSSQEQAAALASEASGSIELIEQLESARRELATEQQQKL
eukprot:SAG25_NODE_10323_length_338_cov_0.694561_1_plen_65_part_10